jgi:plastocyanin
LTRGRSPSRPAIRSTGSTTKEVERNVVATDGATFKSDTFGKDGTFKVKTEKPGKISYVCTIHEGMGGSITVE